MVAREKWERRGLRLFAQRIAPPVKQVPSIQFVPFRSRQHLKSTWLVIIKTSFRYQKFLTLFQEAPRSGASLAAVLLQTAPYYMHIPPADKSSRHTTHA